MTGAEMEFVENLASGAAYFVAAMAVLYGFWRWFMEKM